MCFVAWYLLFEICRLFLCLRYNQNLIFSYEFHIIRIYKKFLFRVCFYGLFFECFLLRGCGDCFFLIVWFDWLFRLVVFYWTVVILWGRREIMVGRCIAMLPLLNPVSKRVRADSGFKRLNFWFWWILFVVKTHLCSERRFANDEKVKSFAK